MRLDEIGENYENLKGYGGAILDQQDRARERRTEKDVCADGGGPLEWQRTRIGGLGRCRRGLKGIVMLQLRADGTLREGKARINGESATEARDTLQVRAWR